MKRTEITALPAKPASELEFALHAGRERLRILRLDLAAGKVKNVREMRMLRKDIARLETALRAKGQKGTEPRAA